MSFSEGLDLTKSSTQRLIEAANFKYSWFFIDTKPRTDALTGQEFKTNATLLDIEQKSGGGYNAVATYRIDRWANGVPYNFTKDPAKRYLNRRIRLERITANELVKLYGVNGCIEIEYAGEATTKELAPALSKVFGSTVQPDDLYDQRIAEGSTCVTLTFHSKSLAYHGRLNVMLLAELG